MKFTQSIQMRLILAFCLLSASAVAACVAAYYTLATRDFRERAAAELNTAAHVHSVALRERSDRARLIARILASDTTLHECVRARDTARLDSLLRERARDLPADSITVADADGVILSQYESASLVSGPRIRHGAPLFLDALFGKAVSGGNPTALELCKPDLVCMNAFSDVRTHGRVTGYVRAGFALDNNFARNVRRITDTEFILVRGGKAAAASLPGESLSSNEIRTLTQSVKNQAQHNDVRLRGKPWALRGQTLHDAAGRELGRLYIGRDTLALRAARRRAMSALSAIAALALALAVLLGLTLSIPLARPLKTLVDRVRDISRGNLETAISVRRRDEIGRLGDAFNEMTASLRERDHRLRENADELRRNQDQIIQSGKLAAIGELAAGVAHEIGNPLSAISGYAQMLRKDNIDPDTQREYIREIERETEFIERIIQDLLDFSRPSTGQPEPVNLNDIAVAALRTVSSIKTFHNVNVEKDFQEPLPQALANRKEIMQVCLNLYINAAQAMPGGGPLTITTRADARGVVLSVADRGGGVPVELRDKIFDPFFTTKTPSVGTGLGLSISYRIVEKYKGALIYEPRKGGGSIFHVTLPFAPRESAGGASTGGSNEQHNTGH